MEAATVQEIGAELWELQKALEHGPEVQKLQRGLIPEKDPFAPAKGSAAFNALGKGLQRTLQCQRLSSQVTLQVSLRQRRQMLR